MYTGKNRHIYVQYICISIVIWSDLRTIKKWIKTTRHCIIIGVFCERTWRGWDAPSVGRVRVRVRVGVATCSSYTERPRAPLLCCQSRLARTETRLASPLGTLEHHHGLLCHSFTQVRVFKEMYIWIELNWRDSYSQTVVAVRRSIVISFYYVSTEKLTVLSQLWAISYAPLTHFNVWKYEHVDMNAVDSLLFVICVPPLCCPAIWLSLWHVCGCYSMGFLSIHSCGTYVCPVT